MKTIRDYVANIGRALRGIATGDFYGHPAVGGYLADRASDESSAVVSCLAWISRQVVEPTLREFDEKGDEVKDSAAVKAFYNPGAHGVTGRRLMKAAAWAWSGDGNAYLQIVPNLLGEPADLIFRSPLHCEPKADTSSGLLKGYQIGGKLVDPKTVIHFADGIDPANPLRGLAPLKRSARAVMGDVEADVYTSDILRNPAIIGLAFIPEADPGLENALVMTEQLERRFGAGRRGGAFVPSVKGHFERPGLNPEQLALSSIRRDQEARIAGATGVPAVVAQLGVGLEHSTFANYEEARSAGTENVLVPLWSEWGETLTLQYLPLFRNTEGHTLRFDVNEVRALKESADAVNGRTLSKWEKGVIDRETAKNELGYETTAEDKGFYHPRLTTPERRTTLPDRT